MAQPTAIVRPEPHQAIVRLDAQALITKALESNANVETLERLVALAKDMRAVQAREAWHEAMAAFQRDCPRITKDSTAKITSRRTGQSFSYRFASLDEILAAIRPTLATHGLSVTWRSRTESKHVSTSCRVSHVLGHSEDGGEVSIPIQDSDNPAQAVGIATTYSRRYAMNNALGIAPEDDDDAGEQDAQHRSQSRPSPEPTRTEMREERGGERESEVPDTRDEMMAEIRALGKKAKLSADERRVAWETYCGSATPEDVDPAALSSMIDWLRTRVSA